MLARLVSVNNNDALAVLRRLCVHQVELIDNSVNTSAPQAILVHNISVQAIKTTWKDKTLEWPKNVYCHIAMVYRSVCLVKYYTNFRSMYLWK